MSDGFERAPGVGRGRGRGRGIETAEGGKTPGFSGASGAGDEPGRAKAAGSQQQEPLRPPRTGPPGGGGDAGAAQTSHKRTSPAAQLPAHTYTMAVSKAQPADRGRLLSNLSANAAEFYPSGYSVEANNCVEENGCYPVLPEGTLTEYVQDFLNHLTEQPGSFEAEVFPFSDVLNNCVTTDESLQELVELIYQQAISVPNFSYTGARLCNYLSNNLHINPQNQNFRQLLLKRCQTEFEKRDQAAKGDGAARKQFHAFVLFLGELYLNLEIKGAKGQVTRAEILQSGLQELLNSLFSNPVDDNLMCAVKLLKLTGSVLEDAWKEKALSCMEEVMLRMKNVVLDANCSRDVKQMLLKLVELRSSNWGRVHAASTFKEATPENDPNYFMNEPTFYTSEGVPFTAADPDYQEKYQELLDREDFFRDYDENGTDGGDSYFEDDDDNEMDPEMEEAYEKFCLESEHKKKQ
ncbi:polyadenylate-binding protein-interacting protein 1 [Xenopus laevis]|uniref:Polyadenylate-binding protein-interacting protein 1 n=2 Tax=Xenopus laevis TaxID=8355 RepID=PAIP1_XENLA|nr:polyadenylate-binding protein-interacting protein 1 [Xenopus laevis]Q7ZYB4.1 RecName: Full=Polyadenylate-binding protein-interacting protein 1; Short=PABP-interacting protein 1; Short=PAIP-1; Short=Paip1 protein; Short=Poly(A)-binding protein-interacting protein 1; AltName: Full=XlPaip1 [Xenopus laevis]AAH43861.1 Paip1-pending-prov protein [Xenopus laevis]AAI23120.1 Paip1-pending protein [Xenopus laevis]